MDNVSRPLIQRIRDAINTEGMPALAEDGTSCLAIPFDQYMAMCLYDEQFGYYRSGAVRTGRSGDFYTSGAIGGVMGQMWARFLHKSSAGCIEPPIIVEWAAGAGAMTGAMLDSWTEQTPDWLDRIEYWAVDDHPLHLASTRELANSVLERWGRRKDIRCIGSDEALESLVDIPQGKPVLIAANELIDALPVHRVAMVNGQLKEIGVCIRSDQEDVPFGYAHMPVTSPELAAALEADGVLLAERQETEVNLAAGRWLAELGNAVQSGMLLIADYGHEAEEYCAAHRMKGTLMCYRRHVAHDNPFVVPGEQDITAHVNFTALKRAAAQAGWDIAYEGTQLQFLLDQGIMELLKDHDGTDPFSGKAKQNRAVRQLLLSDGMSETFKAIVLTRGGFKLPPEQQAT